MAAFWDSEKEITRFEKNKKETVIVKEVAKSGKEYIELRTYFMNEDDELRPSQKGLTVPKEKAKEQFEAILKHLN